MFATGGRVDTLDPAVSVRRVWVLATRLPPAAQAIGEPWSAEAHLLALLADRVAELTWVTVKAAGGKGPRPKPLPRPREDAAADGPAAGGPAPPSRPAGPPLPSGPGGWEAAAAKLALMPGVSVSHG
jgi:hypothetical protein